MLKIDTKEDISVFRLHSGFWSIELLRSKS